MENLTIRKLIENLSDGQIRVPAFQRGYVWNSDDVAFLMDTIYRGFPFGSLLLWRTREQLPQERTLGPFVLPPPNADWPIDYVLDGQQRITSIYGVFAAPAGDAEVQAWFDIYFDLTAPEGALESQFVALPRDKVVQGQHFPLRVLFDVVKYRESTQSLTDANIMRLDLLQSAFKEATIPAEIIEVKTREDVAIVFERINRAGVALDDFELLSAWTWSTEFDLRNAFQELSAEVDPFGFGEINSDPNLLIKCCAAVVSGDASTRSVINLHGPTVRERFEEIRSGVMGALDFLRTQLNVHSLRIMPYPSMLVPLAVFYSTTAAAGIHADATQLKELKRWFWRSCFSRRYSSSVNTAHATDISKMLALKVKNSTILTDFPCELDQRFFLENQFNLNSVNTKSEILLLANNSPRSLLSGAKVNLESVLKVCNRAEFHHIFPRKYLEREQIPSNSQNVLANFCFLSSADNQTIKDQKPSDYQKLIPAISRSDILRSNLIPDSSLSESYDDFLKHRAEMLVAAAGGLV